MTEQKQPDVTHPHERRIKVQRAKNGLFHGACLSLSVDDLSFVGSGVGWLAVETKADENALIIQIKVV